MTTCDWFLVGWMTLFGAVIGYVLGSIHTERAMTAAADRAAKRAARRLLGERWVDPKTLVIRKP